MATCSIAAAKRAAHDHDQHLGMRTRAIGAEQLINLLLCEAQSVEHHVAVVGQQQHLDAAAQSAQGERVTGERSSGALAM